MIAVHRIHRQHLQLTGFGIVLSLAWLGSTPHVQAICGLNGAAQEQLGDVRDPDALRELNRQLMPIGRLSQSCMVCHLAGAGGPRNVFGSAINTLLRIDDRENPLRQRDAGRRMTDIPWNPNLPDSPTFAEVFQQGRLPEKLFGPEEPPLRKVSAKVSEDITPDRARELVRETEAKSRWEILQLSRTFEMAPEAAEALAEFHGEMLILGLKELTPEVAAALATSNAATVWLHSVTSVSPEAAEAIAKLPGHLVLTGLAELDSLPLAEKLVQRPCALTFPYLKTISPEIATALANEDKQLTLAGLTNPSPEVQDKLAETAGSLYLPYLKSLDSMALTRKLASPFLVLPALEKITAEQAKEFAAIPGAGIFFTGSYLPLAAFTPEVAAVYAESPNKPSLTLLGKGPLSDNVLRSLKKSGASIVLQDVESLTSEQTRIAGAPGGASISFPGLRSLDSALLAQTFQTNLGSLAGVTSISPEAAAVLGSLPELEVVRPDGTVEIRPSGDLSLPSLRELPTETARLLLKRRWLSISLPSLEDVSLGTVQALARQTFRLTLGIPSLPPEFADAFSGTPTDTNQGGGYILFPNVSDVSPESARILVESLNRGVQDLGHTRISKSPKLYFGGDFSSSGSGYPSLSPEAAVELAKYEGFLAIRGLGDLPDASAAALASFPGPYLVLSGPATQRISPEAAQSLAKVPGVLQLDLRELDSVPLAERVARQINWTLSQTETVSREAAPALSQYKQFFNLRFLTVLDSPEMARRFVEGTTSGTGIALPALASLTPETAEILGAGAKSLYLGLSVLDSTAVATALATAPAGVNLFRLRAATPEVMAILKEAKSIETPLLDSVKVLSETDG